MKRTQGVVLNRPPTAFAGTFGPRDSTAEAARAFRAVRRMTDMLPMLNGILRVMTGRTDVQVRITSGVPCTDGRIVYLRPPIELGDTVAHDRKLCSRRDENSSPVCPACKQMEKVDETFFHEMAHIVFESMVQVDPAEQSALLTRVLMEHPGLKGSRLAAMQQRITEAFLSNRANYMGIAQIVSPFLPTIINALEDARVNQQMYQVRNGTYHMFRAKIIETLTNGVDRLDGTTFRWSGEDENAQVIIGCLCKASGYDPKEGQLSDNVLKALSDPTLTAEVTADAADARAVYHRSFRVLELLRGLGFCRRPDDPEDEPEPEQSQEQSDEPQDSDDTESQDEEGEGVSEPSPDADSEDSTDSGEPGDDDDSEPESGDDDGDSSDDKSDDDASDDDELDESGGGDDDEQQSDSSPDDADADETDDGSESETEPSDAEREPAPGSDGLSSDGEDNDDGDELGEGEEDAQPDDDEDSEVDGSSGDSSDELSDDVPEPDEDGDAGADAGSDAPGFDQEEADERMEHSDPDTVAKLIQIFGGHDPDNQDVDPDTERQLGRAIIQAEQMDEASNTVSHYNVHHFDAPTERTCKLSWHCLDPQADADRWTRPCFDTADMYEVPESMIGRALLKMRVIFADNKKSIQTGAHRHGSIIASKLPGVMSGNYKVFSQRRQPGRKDYFVCLALDVSGSTQGQRLINIKKMGLTMGALLNRCGVKFAIYAHTGSYIGQGTYGGQYEGDVFVIKEENDPWDERAKDRLAKLNSSGNNLDGHALEFMRKRCDRSTATDKVLLYVTDGDMPEANDQDEEVVLRREIAECRKRRYSLVGVGIATDSPRQYGLDTIQIDDPEDISLLVRELERRLAVRV